MRASVAVKRSCKLSCALVLRVTLDCKPTLRVSIAPSLPSAASANDLKRRTKPEPAAVLASAVSMLRSSVMLPSALSSLTALVSSVPSVLRVKPISDKRPQVDDAVLPWLMAPRNWLCMPSAPWSPCNWPATLLSAL